MIKYREIIRLRSKGVSYRNIAYSCGCSKSTAQTVIKKATAAGLCWPLPEKIDDAEVYRILFVTGRRTTEKVEPDFEHVNRELLKSGVTLMLCWNEYCKRCIDENREPYQYSAFCRHYRAWAKTQNVVAHLEHRPGEIIMVDWAGTTMETIDRDTGEAHKVYVFVACLPYSAHLYAEGFHSMDSESWMRAHINAFEYFGGVTPIVIPDNLKTGITKNTIDELIVNRNFRRLAEYYGFAVIPARPRKPRDKAAVESGVGVVTRSAIAPLRDQVFFSLDDLNDALADKMAEIASRPFQKREGSRQSVFFGEEKDALCPLPAQRFEVYVSKTATVPYNYHISVDSIYYSVPFTLAKQEVEVRITRNSVSVYARNERVAMHKRSYARRGTYVTNPDHMPDAHKDFTEWNGNRFRKWASQMGEGVAGVIAAILISKPIEQQTYRSCRAVIALADKYGNAKLDEACTRALAISKTPSYKTVKTLIAHIIDDADDQTDKTFAYLRGADYFNSTIQGDDSNGQ